MAVTFCFKDPKMSVEDFLGFRKIKEHFKLNLADEPSCPVDELIVRMNIDFNDCENIIDLDGRYVDHDITTQRVVVTYAHNDKRDVSTTGAISLKDHKWAIQWEYEYLDKNTIAAVIKKLACLE